MEFLFEIIFEFIVDLWERYATKKCNQYDFDQRNKAMKVIRVITWNVLAILGSVLILSIFIAVMFLVGWLFDVNY